MIKPNRNGTEGMLTRDGAQRIRAGVEKLAEPAAARRTLEQLLVAVRNCRVCASHLPLGPRPILSAQASARILVVGQAPGARVHASGIPWDDASGERLRAWMGVDATTFHDPARIAIIPMGYCYPGRGAGGDLPPRRECAALWLDQLLARLPRIELTLLIGQHAQRHFLGNRRKPSLAETTRAWRDYAPEYVPLPHPSPRNQPWFKRHPWFERQLVPMLRARIAALAGR
jgi:uracil-DNA glycosylase